MSEILLNTCGGFGGGGVGSHVCYKAMSKVQWNTCGGFEDPKVFM